MPLLPRLASLMRHLFRKERAERELDAELAAFLDSLTQEKIAAGLSPQEARRAARVELGGMEQVKEEVRAARSGVWLDTLARDIRYAVRMLAGKPGFTAVAVLTLALGIGAGTAIFTVVQSVLLRPLPYPHAEQLVFVHQTALERGGEPIPISPPNYVDFQREARSFVHFGAGATTTANLTDDEPLAGGGPERVDAAYVNAELLAALGVRPQAGRLLVASDEAAGAAPVVLLSHGLWSRRFGADASVVGSTIHIDEKPHAVAGVLPRGVRYPLDADVWLPLRFAAGEMQERYSFYLEGVARLAPGVTPAQAQAELDALARRLRASVPELEKFGIGLVPLHEQTVGEARPALLFLLGAVAVVWLIACANMASLMLSHAASRERELAVRAALGAGRARLAAQLLTESLLLALTGGAAGLALGQWCLEGLIALRPQHLPRVDEIHLDPSVLAFAAGLSLLAGVLFGLAPALRASRPDWGASLKSGAQTAAAPHARMRGALVVGQLALSLVLLAAAGLMLRTMWNLLSTPLGFDPAGVLVADISLPRSKYPDDARRAAFLDAVLEQLRAQPGLEAAGATSNLPLSGSNMTYGFLMEGRPEDYRQQGEPLSANFRTVSPDYLSLLRIPLRRGRGIEARDRAGAPEVVVINEAMARRFWPGEDPIGRRIRVARGQEPAWREIVGVVGNIRHEGLDREPRPEMYVPFAQQSIRFVRLAVRAAGDPTTLASAVRQAVWQVDPNQPVSRLRTMDEVVAAATGERRFYGVLLGAFAALALGLASVGLYGVMSYAVASRTREIGIRLALGAERGAIFRMVLGRGARLAAAGIALGLGGALAATRGLEQLLYGVLPTDPLTLASVAGTLAVVALLASWLPARRATHVDPAVTLRYE